MPIQIKNLDLTFLETCIFNTYPTIAPHKDHLLRMHKKYNKDANTAAAE